MKFSNVHNLPEAIVNAVSAYNYPPKEGRYSVTDLISPPQIRQLKMKFFDVLSEDVSERLWALLGQACHAVLDKSKPVDALAEEKLVVDFEGVTISGKSDLYHDGSLEDYKITSTFSFLLSDKIEICECTKCGGCDMPPQREARRNMNCPKCGEKMITKKIGCKKEWFFQLQVYAWLHTRLGMPVKELWIRAILRDWQGSKVKADPDYPKISFQSVPVPLWTLDEQERYIRARIEAHKALNPQCSNEERWLRASSWAVMKNDNKRAFRVFDNIEQAENLAKTDKSFTVIERKGSYNRCLSYCPVRAVCPQWQKEKELNYD